MSEGKRRRKLADHEQVLWRTVTRSIKPLRHKPPPAESDEPEPAERKAAPAPVARAAPVVTPQAVPAPKRPPAPASLDRRQKQRLARGREPINARLDLHGCTQGEAHAALLHFLRRAQADGARFALVITGKGARADDFGGRGVLKRQVPLWLRLPEFRSYVVGFEDAYAGHGGEGALYVHVKRLRKSD